jgi:hypothetical protein
MFTKSLPGLPNVQKLFKSGRHADETEQLFDDAQAL